MKIAFVNQPWNSFSVPADSGSIAIWIYHVSTRLPKICDITVYSKKDSSQKSTDIKSGLRCRRFSIGPDLWLLRMVRRIGRLFGKKINLFGNGCYYFFYILFISIDLRRQCCDIVHVHNFSQFVPIIRFFNPYIKIVLHMHCDWLLQIDQRKVEKRLEKTDLIIGCSSYITERISQNFLQHSQKCCYLHNGVDTNLFIPDKGTSVCDQRKQLLFVGRVSPEKGVHILLEAFNKIEKIFRTVQLYIVGAEALAPKDFVIHRCTDDKVKSLEPLFDSDYSQTLRNILSDSAAEKVIFVGPVPNQKLISYYQNSDLFLFPSIWEEPFGMPLVEAMSCGLAVVTTAGGGISEIVSEGKTGFLVGRGNAEELTKSVLRLLFDDQLRVDMGKNGRQRALQFFSWYITAEKLFSQYLRMFEDSANSFDKKNQTKRGHKAIFGGHR